MRRLLIAPLAWGLLAWGLLAGPGLACATEIGVIGFQFSSETHARTAGAAAEAARKKGWSVTLLNSEGSLPKHAAQLDQLIAKRVDAIIVAMGKPVEAEAQFHAAREAGIPVITVQSGGSPETLFDIETDEWKVGADMSLYLLGRIGYSGKILEERFELNVATRIRGRELDAILAENTGVKPIGAHSMARTGAWQQDVRSGMQALLLQNHGRVNAIWASFDGQAYIIDDLLQAEGATRKDTPIVSADGGAETFRRIADPASCIVATVDVPFERMGEMAVDAVERIVVQHQPKASVAPGPILYVDAVLVDEGNVRQFLK